jgi:hypothetical protein
VDLRRPVVAPEGPSAGGAAVLTARSDRSLGVETGADGPGPDRRQWRVRCQDVANRERFVTVLVEHGRVVLVGPPGETTVLSAGQLDQLRSVLREAADEAER